LFALITVVVHNQEELHTNLSVHSINKRNKYHLHRLIARLVCFRRWCILCCHRNIQKFTVQTHRT